MVIRITKHEVCGLSGASKQGQQGSICFLDEKMGSETKINGVFVDNIHSLIERRPDTLESILWDAEAQKLSVPALVGFVVSEIKIRIPA